MKLFDYFRSSAAYRVRIALRLKGLDYEPVSVHLRKGEQRASDYLGRNPLGLVPTLENTGLTVTQSLAIMEYLEEIHPKPSLLPPDPQGRSRVRSIALAIACDIHPINNLRVLNYLRDVLDIDEAGRAEWYRQWVGEGFTGIEQMLAQSRETGRFCHGDSPGMADACLVPQVMNARRFDLDMTAFPTISRIDAACSELPAFQAAHPRRQPDWEE